MSGQEKYKLKMENMLRLNITLNHVTHLGTSGCTLELTDYQLPIAEAIRRIKNLTTLRLESIKLHSSTFLEIESKKLRKLYLCYCKTPLPIAPLFKSDLCYKDSLIELNLEGNRWSEIPNGIFQFQNLLKLSLTNNCITELPDKFTNFPKLQELELSHNRLRHIPPSIFALQHLLKLSLSGNFISELPNTFANLSKLQVLKLSYNELTSVPPSILQLQNLCELNLNGNFITELPDVIILLKLETLLLCNNELTYVPPSVFEVQNLSELSISFNNITELPDKFTNLSKLKYLSLSRNQLRHLPPSICSLHLVTLDIADNPFNLEIPPSFGSEMVLFSLKELSYRTILNHELKVEEGVLPMELLKDLDNYRQCVCGCKFVDGQELSFSINLNDISDFSFYNDDPHLRVPIRGNVCTSLKSCFLDCFPKCR